MGKSSLWLRASSNQSKFKSRVDTSKNRLIDHRVKELVLLCQLKLHMKPTISHYSVNQQCQVH